MKNAKMDNSGIGIGNLGLLLIRFELAAIFWVHGWPKLSPNGPMHGPQGFRGYLQSIGVPNPVLAAWVVIILETAGPVLLVLGLLVRIIGFLLAIEMAVAIALVKKNDGFSRSTGVGWEFEFALLIQALALLFLGPGIIAL